MPGGNRMGPTGQGPRSGRGAGYCGGNQAPGAATGGQRQSGGRRRGRGGGRGWRNMFHATGLTGWQRAAADSQSSDDPATPPSESAVANQVDRAEQEEVAVLKQQASEILRSLQNIQDRLAKLESSSERDRPSESTESAVE